MYLPTDHGPIAIIETSYEKNKPTYFQPSQPALRVQHHALLRAGLAAVPQQYRVLLRRTRTAHHRRSDRDTHVFPFLLACYGWRQSTPRCNHLNRSLIELQISFYYTRQGLVFGMCSHLV